MTHRPFRRFPAGRGAALALTLSLGATALTGVGTADGAPPVADCTRPFPVADLVAGDPVHGLTVVSGTSPITFTGQVLGTREDGIAPDVDMVMVKVDPTGLATDEVKGIWQGMSGSPVYAADGRLIGAIAYGLSTQQSWVAGVTPFEDMNDYGAPAARVALDQRTAARIAQASGTTTAQAARGFAQLPAPLAVSGVPARFLNPRAATLAKHSWLRSDLYAAGRSARLSVGGAETMVAGGNLAASTSYGDVTAAGVGTVTSVCNGDVVGFGHPMNFAGDTTMSLHPAEAVYIQGDNPSFKVANIGAPVGTVFGDHLTGLTGRFGATPAVTTVSYKVTSGTRTRTGTTYVTVRTPDNLAMTTYLQGAANRSRVVDGARPGSEVLTFRINGLNGHGKPFSLTWTDRIRSTTDVTNEASMYVADFVASIAAVPDVTIDSISVDAKVTTTTKRYRLVRIDQLVGRTWVPVGVKSPVVGRAGHSIRLRAALRQGTKGVRVPFTFDVPRRTSGKVAMLSFSTGTMTSMEIGETIGSVSKALSKALRNDVVRAEFGRVSAADPGGFPGDGGEDEGEYDGEYRVPKDPTPGASMVSFVKTKTSAPIDAVLVGALVAPVVIR